MMCAKSRVPAGSRTARWLSDLDREQVQFLILDAERDCDLLDAARTHPAWTLDCEDGNTILLARSTHSDVAGRGRVPKSGIEPRG